MIVLAPDEVQVQTVSVEVQERLKAGRKKAKKIRQRISAKTKDYEAPPTSSAKTLPPSKHQARYGILPVRILREELYYGSTC